MEAVHVGYKEAKEAFVAGSNGGTVTRINSVCITALTTYALWTSFEPLLRPQGRLVTWRTAVAEYFILVIPLLLALTALSNYPIYLNTSITALSLLIRQIFPVPAPPAFPPSTKERSVENPPPRLFSKPFVTIYRAHMMLITVICILAVDFKIFPREFAKTETWGTSIMDIGVGSFVFALGMVSALPLLRLKERRSFLPAIWSSAKRSGSVLALGLVRVIMVKGVEYPEHVTEYGVHWNFFFTIGILPVCGALIERLSPMLDYTLMALAITIGHQLALDQTQLQYWTLTADRTDLTSQNKEGIVSLPGYLALYLFGVATGIYCLPPDPYFFSKLHATKTTSHLSPEKTREIEEKKAKVWKEKPGKLGSLLGGYTIMWWSLYGILCWAGWTPSRRMANSPYVVFIVAFNTSLLLAYLLIHMWASSYVKNSTAPALFDAINKNGMLVFLSANLLTGLVNVSMESMYASDTVAVAVLFTYCAAVMSVAWYFKNRSLRI